MVKQRSLEAKIFKVGSEWLGYPTRFLELLALKAFFGFAAYNSNTILVNVADHIASLVLLGWLFLPVAVFVIPRFQLRNFQVSPSYLARLVTFVIFCLALLFTSYFLGQTVTMLTVSQLS
jgi:hypothetical protein